jgi:hypothetical protein
MAGRFEQGERDKAQAWLDSQNNVPRENNQFSQWQVGQNFGGVFPAIESAEEAKLKREIDAQNFQPAQTAEDYDQLAANLQQQQAAPAPGMQLASMPAAPVLASDVVKPQQEFSKSQAFTGLNNLEDAYAMQQLGVANAAQAGAQKAAAETAYFQQQQKDMERLQAEQAIREQERQKAMVAEQEKLNQSIEEFGSLKVDPKRLYNNMDTGDKVLAAIGLILGAFGRNGNQSVEVLQNAVNRDIDAQKAEIAAKGDKINAQRGVYAQMLSRFGDERQADAATRIALIQNSQLKAQEIASKYKSPEIQANAQQLFAQLEVQKQEALLKFQQSAQVKNSIQGNDSVFGRVMAVVPKELQGEAIKEVKAVSDWNKLTNDLQTEYQTLNKVGAVSAKTPGFLGGERGSYQAGKAKIAGALVGKVPGIKSDSDFKNIVEPMLPAPMDTESEQVKKMNKFTSWLASQGPSAPILEGYGVKPQTKEEAKASLGAAAPIRTSGTK